MCCTRMHMHGHVHAHTPTHTHPYARIWGIRGHAREGRGARGARRVVGERARRAAGKLLAAPGGPDHWGGTGGGAAETRSSQTLHLRGPGGERVLASAGEMENRAERGHRSRRAAAPHTSAGCTGVQIWAHHWAGEGADLGRPGPRPHSGWRPPAPRFFGFLGDSRGRASQGPFWAFWSQLSEGKWFT